MARNRSLKLLLPAMITGMSLLSGCQTTATEQEAAPVIPTIKVPLVAYKLSDRPSADWSAYSDPVKAKYVSNW